MPRRVSLKSSRASVAARRLETRERRPTARQAEVADHPSESEFGAPEYVDQAGRQYRVAYCSRMGGWAPGAHVPSRPLHDRAHQPVVVKMWIRLRRGDTARWFYSGAEPGNARLILRAVRPGLQDAAAEVVFSFRERPGRRTGYVLVKTEQVL